MRRPFALAHRAVLASLPALFAFAPALPAQDSTTESEPKVTSSTVRALAFRELGPGLTSGRIADIAVDPSDARHWLIAAASGGLWQTRNAGTTWRSIFDGQSSYALGCVTFDPNDPLTIWVGSGENNGQRAIGYGDGVYKSTDGGRTWKNLGLKHSEHIAKILVDPRDSDRVYVASQGPLWREGGERGLYMTADGGTTWTESLVVDEHTGVTDVVMDPTRPDVLYAATHQRRRHVFTLVHGGPGSGLHKSTDGGATWREIRRGLPAGDLGRIGLAIAPTRPTTVYAIVEASRGAASGFYRTTDGGGSWKKRSDYVSRSPQYYQRILVDPNDPDRVYSNDVLMQVSDDGGASWRRLDNDNKHVDNHALWVDPTDTRHLLAGCDGGLYESFDAGATWRFFDNLSLTQFYRVSVDEAFPFYNVYGGTQDNFSLGAPARTTSMHGITNRDWFVTRGGDGFESVIDPTDPNVVYAQSQYGGLVRFDKATGETLDIKPQDPAGGPGLRWNWNAPLLLSHHDHRRLYFAANVLFRSDDRGESWRALSGDLSRGLDRDRIEVMGKLWSPDTPSKNRSTSPYGNVSAFDESPLDERRLWVGTDDGLIHVTNDGGTTWRTTRSIDGVPDTTYVSAIAASLHDANTAFVTFDDHKRGNFAPYVFRTSDGGETWRPIHGDLPERGSVHAFAQDDVEPNLLFCGTEFGLWYSPDAGARWLQLKGGMPPIPVRDIAIQRRENDLVVATFGRGIRVLDDYSPLRSLDATVLAKEAHVFAPRRAWRYVESGPLGRGPKGFQGDAFWRVDNADSGAVFTYWIGIDHDSRRDQRRAAEASARKAGEPVPQPSWSALRAEDREAAPRVLLVVRDADRNVVRRLSGRAGKGLHRSEWDLRAAASRGGAIVPAGAYSVEVVYVDVHGAARTLAEPVEFVLENLPGATFELRDAKAAGSFHADMAAAVRSADAAAATARRVTERLDALDRAIVATAASELTWLERVHGLRAQLADVDAELNGDSTISSRYGTQRASIRQRLWNARGSARSTLDPTATQRESLRLARERLTAALAVLRELEAGVASLETRVEAAGGPVRSGALPAEASAGSGRDRSPR